MGPNLTEATGENGHSNSMEEDDEEDFENAQMQAHANVVVIALLGNNRQGKGKI